MFLGDAVGTFAEVVAMSATSRCRHAMQSRQQANPLSPPVQEYAPCPARNLLSLILALAAAPTIAEHGHACRALAAHHR
ncbi:hypothetical protein KM539_09680 [Xanthomonas translucens pv. poae]|uniref:hypothetical protein n=1 Tax=Xanthomonas graminis TaxID=3390026 RepID=UPI001112F926|nr:hypothetical protein [Xanthomonas translucens]UKE63677.1 hypothetical protein KM539_09680 [Xanthomonas translucens pv. poae]